MGIPAERFVVGKIIIYLISIDHPSMEEKVKTDWIRNNAVRLTEFITAIINLDYTNGYLQSEY